VLLGEEAKYKSNSRLLDPTKDQTHDPSDAIPIGRSLPENAVVKHCKHLPSMFNTGRHGQFGVIYLLSDC